MKILEFFEISPNEESFKESSTQMRLTEEVKGDVTQLIAERKTGNNGNVRNNVII